jgi:hypothetical protein
LGDLGLRRHGSCGLSPASTAFSSMTRRR